MHACSQPGRRTVVGDAEVACTVTGGTWESTYTADAEAGAGAGVHETLAVADDGTLTQARVCADGTAIRWTGRYTAVAGSTNALSVTWDGCAPTQSGCAPCESPGPHRATVTASLDRACSRLVWVDLTAGTRLYQRS